MPLQKLVKTHADLVTWKESQAYSDIISLVTAMSRAIRGKKISDVEKGPQSEVVKTLRSIIKEGSDLIDAVPPIEQPMRFGNKAFRTWLQRVREVSPEWVARLLALGGNIAAGNTNAGNNASSDNNDDDGTPAPEVCGEELVCYLCGSFGNETRVDYGSGHELSFVAFLACLFRLGLLSGGDAMKREQQDTAENPRDPRAAADEPAPEDTGDLSQAALLVFNDYILLCRKLQLVYVLEPAGSHGVWGLDDYQFIPFYLGAAQLTGHAHIKPKSIHNEEIVMGFSGEYMYLACIAFINRVKTGPFYEHSMYLNDVSNVASWRKINTGLLKMYEAEVLGKFPVVQHVPFGQLLKFDKAK